MLYAFFALAAVRFAREPELRARRVPHLLLFLAYVAFAVPSRLAQTHLQGLAQGAWAVFRNGLEILPFLYVAPSLARLREDRARRAVTVLLVAATLTAGIGIAQTLSQGRVLTGGGVHGNLRYLGLFPPYPADRQPLLRATIGRATVVTHVPGFDIYRAQGGLSSHNFLGSFLVLTTALCLGLAFTTGRELWLLPGAIQALALALTYSRAALLGFVLSVGVILLLRRPPVRALAASAVLLGAVIFPFLADPRGSGRALAQGFGRRVGTILMADGRVPLEMAARFQGWRLAAAGIVESPLRLLLGHGTGAIPGFQIAGALLTAHNDALDMVYARGLLSFLGAVALFALVFRDAAGLFREGPTPFARGLGLALLGGGAGLLLAGLSNRVLGVADVGPMVWFLAGLAVSMRARRAEDAAAPGGR